MPWETHMKSIISVIALAAGIGLAASAHAEISCLPTSAHAGINAFHFKCGEGWYGFLYSAPNAGAMAAIVANAVGSFPLSLTLWSPSSPGTVPCGPLICDGASSATAVQGVQRTLPF